MRKPISNGLRFDVLSKFNFKCSYCGVDAVKSALEIDHIIPISRGGSNDFINLVTACKSCNRGKYNKILNEENLSIIKEISNENDIYFRFFNELDESQLYDLKTIEDIFKNRFPNQSINNEIRYEIHDFLEDLGVCDVVCCAENAIQYLMWESFESVLKYFLESCLNTLYEKSPIVR